MLMNPSPAAPLARLLRNRRRRLARRARQQREPLACASPATRDPVDQALCEIERGTAQLLMQIEQREIERLLHAELATKNRRPGTCRCCGETIEPRRLIVQPGSVLCAVCAADPDQTDRSTSVARRESRTR